MTTIDLRKFSLLSISLCSCVFILTLAYLENFARSEAGFIALLVYAPQQGFALLPVILTLIAVRKRRSKLAVFNALTLLIWVYCLLGWNVPLSALSPFAPASSEFRVMTYNVQRGERGMTGLMADIKTENPDILCVQESQDPPPKYFPYPGNELQTQLRGWNAAQGGDVLTLSRFPLVSKRIWPLEGPRRILETVWQTPRGPVRVLNIHIVKSDAEGQLQERAFATFASQLMSNARAASQARLEQLPALQNAIEDQPEVPLVVAGDFNSPPRGSFYRALRFYLDDAWKQSGWGHQATFPSRWPLVGIDHIFLRRARATRALVPDSRASDHRPLVADVVLN